MAYTISDSDENLFILQCIYYFRMRIYLIIRLFSWTDVVKPTILICSSKPAQLAVWLCDWILTFYLLQSMPYTISDTDENRFIWQCI